MTANQLTINRRTQRVGGALRAAGNAVKVNQLVNAGAKLLAREANTLANTIQTGKDLVCSTTGYLCPAKPQSQGSSRAKSSRNARPISMAPMAIGANYTNKRTETFRIKLERNDFLTSVELSKKSLAGPRIYDFPINALCAATFPTLSTMASSFGKFSVKKLSVRYEPFCPSTTAGLVALAFRSAEDAAQPTSVAALSSYRNSAHGSVWSPHTLVVDKKSLLVTLRKFTGPDLVGAFAGYLVDHGGIAPGPGQWGLPLGHDNSGLASYGHLYIGTDYNAVDTDIPIGVVYLDYTVELYDPIYDPNLLALARTSSGRFVSQVNGNDVYPFNYPQGGTDAYFRFINYNVAAPLGFNIAGASPYGNDSRKIMFMAVGEYTLTMNIVTTNAVAATSATFTNVTDDITWLTPATIASDSAAKRTIVRARVSVREPSQVSAIYVTYGGAPGDSWTGFEVTPATVVDENW